MKPITRTLSAPLVALVLLPTTAQAAKAPPPPPETILHIDASATVPPDQAKVTITLSGKGATEDEAMADLASRQKAFAEQLRQIGMSGAVIENGDVTVGASTTDMDEMAAAYVAEDAALASADAAASAARSSKRKAAVQAAPKPVLATAPTTVTVSDLSKLDGLRSVGELYGTRSYQFQRGVRFVTSDPDAARKSARGSAIAKAKREAEDYAASLGYKVVRMTRVSNSSPPIAMGDIYGLFGMIDTMPERFMPSYYGATTSVSVSIDFAIMPN